MENRESYESNLLSHEETMKLIKLAQQGDEEAKKNWFVAI